MPVTPDDRATEELVRSLLDRHVDGFVMALGDDGLSVDVPPGLSLSTQRVAAGRSVLDLVEGSARLAVIDAWTQVREQGAARTRVRLAGDGGEVVVHFLDARALHGVHLAFLHLLDGGDLPRRTGTGDTAPPSPPRAAVVRKDELAAFIGVDAATTGMLGWTPADLLGCRSLDLVHPDDHDRAIESWLDLLEHPEHQERVRLRYRTRADAWRWLEVTNHNRLHDPDHGDVLAEMIDVTDEVAAVEALRASEQLLRRLADTVPVGLAQVDRHGRITYANDQLVALVGQPATPLLADQFAGANPDDADALDEALAAVLADGLDRDVECRFDAAEPGAETVRAAVSIRALADGAGAPTGAILCLTDITESVRQRNALAERARRDPLTGTHNRLGILAELDRLLAAGDRPIAVLFVDLDGFKRVNDELGHTAGDELLRAVARRLTAAMRPHDTVGRLGGDEFVVVCPDADAGDAAELAERADLALRSPLVLDGEVVPMRASVGLAHTVGGGLEPTAVIAAADGAMYQAKHDRRAGGPGRPVTVDADEPPRRTG